MIWFKKHQRVVGKNVSIVVAMCDEDLLGKKITGKKAVLDLLTYANFYKGENVSISQAQALLGEFFNSDQNFSFNLVGEKTLKAAANYVDGSKAKK